MEDDIRVKEKAPVLADERPLDRVAEPMQHDDVVAGSPETPPSNSGLQHVDDTEVVMLLKEDKAVCTNDTLEDLRRALTYEAVFASLLEKKVMAMKRDCEERKRAKRMKRKSIGRIFFSKKLFGSTGSRKSSMCRAASDVGLQPLPHDLWDDRDEMEHVVVCAEGVRSFDEIEFASGSPESSEKKPKTKSKNLTAIESVLASTTTPSTTRQQQADESVASTLTNSSDHNSSGQVVKRNLLVRAQTHTPAEVRSSSSSNESAAKPTSARVSSSGNGHSNGLVSSVPERSHYDTTSLASGYENGTGARIHSSTLADDSLTSMRDSIESLSFASSRCTVSFGGTEIIPEDTASLLYERARFAKRLRVMEAKSISAQCSPILPRHLINVIHAPVQASPTQATQNLLSPPERSFKLTRLEPRNIPPPTNTRQTQTQPQTQQQTVPLKAKFLPNQLSYTDSMYGCMEGIDAAALEAAYSRYFTRQNTSEDSANLTASTLLNQSDSLSLHAPICPPTAEIKAASESNTNLFNAPSTTFSLGDRYKSKSLSLLVTSGNGRSRPPPPPPPPLQLSSVDLPMEHITSQAGDQLLLDSLRHTYIANMGERHTHYYPMITTTAPVSTVLEGTSNGAIVPSASMPADTAKLHRMTSTSTGSSVAPIGCCATTTKSSSREREKQRFKPSWPAGQTGSDDEYRRHKRKYKRHHRCSDPVLVYPSPSGLQHCILSIPPNEPVQFPYNEDFAYDMQIQIESDKNDDLEEIVPNNRDRRHRRHRRHKHKKRHRHKKPKILVQDLDTQVVKVIDPDELPQRARWTIIATACLLLLMCLMLVGITLRMAPIIDDMDKP